MKAINEQKHNDWLIILKAIGKAILAILGFIIGVFVMAMIDNFFGKTGFAFFIITIIFLLLVYAFYSDMKFKQKWNDHFKNKKL